ncbi:hypothetical protein L210DRAFT_946452 [Boletus edulis BED1]|uniref:Uncharacterized protein n=1 Tax=Boletus edulis BED1 TaxID=1328754 RepID=A0AAD4GAV1_BOLED|nr:hypothetical protein L210DRAFT_946452 [Boletus edulis BED1]
MESNTKKQPSRARTRYFSCDFCPGKALQWQSHHSSRMESIMMMDVPRASEHPFVACVYL